MVRILVIGYEPDAVDFSDPAVPQGLDKSKVSDGIKTDLQKMHDHGWEAEHLPIRPDENLAERVKAKLQQAAYDCVVVGAGVRMTTKHVPEFEQVVNAVREAAPHTPIAFNSSPDSSGEAARRWLSKA